jgi:hypothetical protein
VAAGSAQAGAAVRSNKASKRWTGICACKRWGNDANEAGWMSPSARAPDAGDSRAASPGHRGDAAAAGSRPSTDKAIQRVGTLHPQTRAPLRRPSDQTPEPPPNPPPRSSPRRLLPAPGPPRSAPHKHTYAKAFGHISTGAAGS